MPTDETYMRLAIAQARLAEGRTSPNPPVGCVLVRGGAVVGAGWTRPPGGPHAEIVALEAAGELARGAVCYTTLEPCDHTGRTGPCSVALIEAGVAAVVYAVADPNPLAAGGAARLRAAGVPARQAPCKAEALDTLRPWLASLGGGALPHLTAKIACSLDGRVATRTGASKWITGEAARARGHDLRQRSDAVIVGVGTVLADDPSLDPRPEGQEPAPGLKVVVDTQLRTPATARLLTSPGGVLIACGEGADAKRRAALEAAGAEIAAFPIDRQRALSPREAGGPDPAKRFEGGARWSGESATSGPSYTPLDIEDAGPPVPPEADHKDGRLSATGGGTGRVDLTALLRHLRTRGCLSAMIEGGPTLLGSAFDAQLVNEVWGFVAPLVIGGGRPAVDGQGPAALSEAFRLSDVRTEQLGPDMFVRGLIEKRLRTEELCSLAS